jgi:hypothetical protein
VGELRHAYTHLIGKTEKRRLYRKKNLDAGDRIMDIKKDQTVRAGFASG